jgi:hypothetical protein
VRRPTGRVKRVYRPLQFSVDVAHGRVRPEGGVDVLLGQVEAGTVQDAAYRVPLAVVPGRVAGGGHREEVVGAAAPVLNVPEPLEDVQLGCEALGSWQAVLYAERVRPASQMSSRGCLTPYNRGAALPSSTPDQ